MQRSRSKSLTTGQATWRFLGIIMAVLGASLLTGDSVGWNVLGTIVLMVIIGIPMVVIAWRSEGRGTG